MGYTFPTSSNDNEILTGSIIPVGDRKFVASKSGGATFLKPVSDYSTSPEYFRGSILEQDDTTYALLHLQQTSYSDSEDDSYFSVPYAVNNVTANADSKFGANAASFNGTDSYIEYKVNDIIDASGPFTWECWVKANTSTSLRTVMGQVSDTQVMSGLFVQTKDNQIKLFSGTTELLSIANDLTGSYHHLAICKFTDFYEQEVLKVFKNGELIGETSGTNVNNLSRQYIPFSLGKDVGSNYFLGKLQELRVTQGFARYHENFAPPTTPFNVSNDGVTHLKFNNDSYLPTDNSDDVAFLTVISQEEEVYTGGIDEHVQSMVTDDGTNLQDISQYSNTHTFGSTTLSSESNFLNLKSWKNVTNYVEVPYFIETSNEHTLEFWIKIDPSASSTVGISLLTLWATDRWSHHRFSKTYGIFRESSTSVKIAKYFSWYNEYRGSYHADYDFSDSITVNADSWLNVAIQYSTDRSQFEYFIGGNLVHTLSSSRYTQPNQGVTRIYFPFPSGNNPWGGATSVLPNDLQQNVLYMQQFRYSDIARYPTSGFIPRDTPFNDDTERQITNANLMFVNNGKVKSLTTTSNFTNLKRDYIELNEQTTLPSSNNTIVYVDSKGELRTSGSFGDKKIALTGV